MRHSIPSDENRPIAIAFFEARTLDNRATDLLLLKDDVGQAVSPALFPTLVIMMPALEKVWDRGVNPLIQGQITEEEAFVRSVAPVHEFIMTHVREADLGRFMNIGEVPPVASPEDIPLRVLIPAFMISEFRRLF